MSTHITTNKYKEMSFPQFIEAYKESECKEFFNSTKSELSSNKSFVKLMVQKNGSYIRYASDELRNDREIILLAGLAIGYEIETISGMYFMKPYTRSEIEMYLPGYYD
jgi:hypothetical protein